jgi:small subunit ribosomal protein S10
MNSLVLKSSYKEILKIYSTYLKLGLQKQKINFSLVGLPKKKKIITLLRSPHVNKKAKDQFEKIEYRFLFQIKNNFNNSFLSQLLKNKPASISIKILKGK